jgi:glycosyltransferase involved in cell wall biosynthesis
LYVGLLERRKGIRDILSVLSIVSGTLPEVRLWIVGSGPEENLMKELCRRMGLSHCVDFLGNIGDEELVTRLNEADIFVFPSLQEGFGLALVEAMACGRPIVAYRYRTSVEIVGDGGILIPERDVASFAGAVIELTDNPAEARKLGEIGRKRASSLYSWPRTAREFASMYEGLEQ